jgi:hypothetical protein
LAVFLAQFSACGAGGPDLPFIFGENDGTPSTNPPPPPPPPPSTRCDSDSDCTGGKICNTSTGQCVDPTCTENPDLCSSTEKCEAGVCVCDETKTDCEPAPPPPPSGACEVNFKAHLGLRADSTIGDQFDIPAACFYYNLEPDNAFNPNPGAFPFNGSETCDFLTDNTCHRDLFCCADTSRPIPSVDADGNKIICDDPSDAIDPDAQGRVLAVTLWKPFNNASMKIFFNVSDAACTYQIRAVDFPQFRLQNSGLDAALIIDAGASSPQDSQLKDLVQTGTCAETADGIALTPDAGTGLRFRVKFFINSLKLAGTNPFETPFSSDAQILPPVAGTPEPPLTFTTGSANASPSAPAASTNPPSQVAPLSITGKPIHDESGKSVMTLVTALTIPVSTNFTNGGGLLGSQLGGGPLTAELTGEVTRASDSQPITSLNDLKSGVCGSTGGGSGRLDLSMKTAFDTVEETLTVSGDPTKTDQPFTAEACVPGKHEGSTCSFFALSELPFAKDTGDPVAGLETRFEKEGTLLIENKDTSSTSITLNVPDKVGAFRIVNASALKNITLAKGNSTTLQIRFEPETSAAGCTTASGVVNCEANLSVSSSHTITIALKGRAKPPAAEVTMEEIEPVTPNGFLASLLPAGSLPTVDFGEALLSIQTKTKLYRISNTGVRNLTLSNIQAQDTQRNFRLGSVYQGASFAGRQFKVGQKPWSVPPTGANDLFFFLNYGPFGRVGAGCNSDPSLRCDTAALAVTTAELGPFVFPLSGQARKDTRAVAGLFVQDENRFNTTGAADLTVAGDKHLYLVQDQFFSFRADPATREVFLKNTGAAGVDELLIKKIQFPSSADFTIVQDPGVASCTDEDLTPCLTLPGDSAVRLGTVTFNPGSGGSYTISSLNLVVAASSKNTQGTEVDPIIGGYFNDDGSVDRSHAGSPIDFALKGAKGAPHKTAPDKFDLRVHRLFAGLSSPFAGVANSVLTGAPMQTITTTTRGALERARPAVDFNKFFESFTIDDIMELDAVNGTVRISPIFTPIVPESSDPSTWPGAIEGLRLFNGPGTLPGGFEFFVQCDEVAGNCAFFYLYLADWSSTLATCGGKPIISPTFPSSDPNQSADPAAEATCMRGALVPINGSYDPVTGDITLSNVAVRLFSPVNPVISQPIDTTIQLDLTTLCVTPDLIRDSLSLDQQLIPERVGPDPLDYTIPGFMPTNPMVPHSSDTACGLKRIHGRPMIAGGVNGVDSTGTLDRGTLGELAASAFDFDLAGVGQIRSHLPQAAGIRMYIIIKAETGDF